MNRQDAITAYRDVFLVGGGRSYIKMNVLQQELDEFRRTPDGKVIQGCSHTSRILSHKYRNKIIMTTYQDLKKYDGSYDAIACCGTSGLMVVPQIAELLNKNIIVGKEEHRWIFGFYG